MRFRIYHIKVNNFVFFPIFIQKSKDAIQRKHPSFFCLFVHQIQYDNFCYDVTILLFILICSIDELKRKILYFIQLCPACFCVCCIGYRVFFFLNVLFNINNNAHLHNKTLYVQNEKPKNFENKIKTKMEHVTFFSLFFLSHSEVTSVKYLGIEMDINGNAKQEY